MTEYRIRLKGGPGSGHYGHKGIPGHQGGSLPKDGKNSGNITADVNTPMRELTPYMLSYSGID